MREAPEFENAAVTKYWLEHYCGMVCRLCGNSGVIDTRETAISATGHNAGRLNYCICPNGQTMRHYETNLDPDYRTRTPVAARD